MSLQGNLMELLHDKWNLSNECCWNIKNSDLGGRGLFAAQPISRGSLIFVNKPLVIGPRADRTRDNHCSICYQINYHCYACEICSLPLCSEKCTKSNDHHQVCEIISKHWFRKTNVERDPKILSKFLTSIHFLLLSNGGKSLLHEFQKTDSITNELDAITSAYTIPEEQIELMKLGTSIVKINSFRVSDSSTVARTPLSGLYPISSFLNHSCVPNTRYIFTSDYSMAVYATKNIDEGDEILCCYTGLLWCTQARRCQLYKTKKFWCKCSRCEDPSEMNTKLSALKCLNKECVGLLLPIAPLEKITTWSCDNCNAKVSPNKVRTIQSVLGSLLGTLDLDDQFKLESIILERLAIFVPYSNHIFVDLRLRVALKLGYAVGLKLTELSESRLALKESLCRGALRIVAALGAGEAYLRGLLLYHMHAALAERARRSPALFEELKTEIESTIEQAYIILQGDISAPPDLELRRQYLGTGCDKPHEERFFILDA